jgi:hypothetical protein
MLKAYKLKAECSKAKDKEEALSRSYLLTFSISQLLFSTLCPMLSAPCSPPKHVVFLNVFANFPGAGHPFWKRHHISLAHFYRFATFGCDDYVSFQKIAGFGFIIRPGKF